MLVLLALLAIAPHDSNGAPLTVQAEQSCGFDAATLTFAGDARQQSRCLLRPVLMGGAAGPEAPLPGSLARRIGKRTRIDPEKLARLIAARPDPFQTGLGPTLGQPVSQTESGIRARYFVIHDTSWPYLGDSPFPEPLNEDERVNTIAGYLTTEAVAHYFVNRRGEIGEGHDFETPWRATKLESRVVGVPARGLFLHIEMIQPRRRDPLDPSPANDRIAPSPGFSSAQYDALALLYVVASHRAGHWLIPAFHANVDRGIPDAHDDPQHFDIDALAAAIKRVRSSVRK